ncbi:MAG: hypothetical protein AAF645_18445 [Myxococcota bacterium]
MARSIRLEVAGLTITRGYDGLLRGDPEPVILLASYAPEGDRLVATMRLSFAARGPFPVTLEWPGDRRTDVPLEDGTGLPVPEGGIVLAVAMEEDSGDDVARIAQALAEPAALKVWSLDGAKSIHALSGLDPDFASPKRVDLENATGALSLSCRYDKWVSAVGWNAPGSASLRFRSRTGRNDWSLQLRADG